MIKAAWLIARKDLRSELRSKESLNAALAFTIVLLLLFSFAFDPTAEETRQWAGGLLWLVFAFSAALIVGRSFARELTNDSLEALRASPVPSSSLFLGKAFASFVLLLGVEVVALPAFSIFYNVTITNDLPLLALVMVLATWGMTVIGVMTSALTVNLHLREVMLPTLVYPMLVPALIAAIELTSIMIEGRPLASADKLYLRLLVGFDIIFTALAVALIDVVLVD